MDHDSIQHAITAKFENERLRRELKTDREAWSRLCFDLRSRNKALEVVHAAADRAVDAFAKHTALVMANRNATEAATEGLNSMKHLAECVAACPPAKPCRTCMGTGVSIGPIPGLEGQGLYEYPAPCPDCQCGDKGLKDPVTVERAELDMLTRVYMAATKPSEGPQS